MTEILISMFVAIGIISAGLQQWKRISKWRIPIKVTTTSLFTIIVFFAPGNLKWLIFSTFVCYTFADFIICKSFYAGLAAFLVGHIILITGYAKDYSQATFLTAIIILVAVRYTIWILQQILSKFEKDKFNPLFIPIIIYAIALILKLSLGIFTMNIFFGLAGGAFILSDSLLIMDKFTIWEVPKKTFWIMSTYYLALILIISGVYCLN